MTAPRFAMITDGEFRRLKADEQDAIFQEAEKHYPDRKTSNRNAIFRWKAVSEAKALYWNSPPPPPPSPVRRLVSAIIDVFDDDPPPRRASYGPISAREANAWLKSLPPFPIAGD